MNSNELLGLGLAHDRLRTISGEVVKTDRRCQTLLRTSACALVSQVAARTGALLAIAIVGLLLALSPQTASAQGKTILIFAPHPDDEALCCSGVISAAKLHGDTVKVVIVTNGDDYANPPSASLGYAREAESVAAMNLLGLNESDVIFLGYGDQLLQTLWQSSSPSTVYTSAAGQTQTYANRGLGLVDYHTLLNGVPGSYSQATILADIQAVIQNFQPDEIYTTGISDNHPDHEGTYQFVSEALIALQQQGLSKVPRIHETIIHEPCPTCNPSYRWPEPPFTPLQPLPVPAYLASSTPYLWNQIESIPVPRSMQDPSPSTNLKEQVISQYPSQGGSDPANWLFSWVKKNEIFWIRNFPTNMAPLATVSVSSETPASGQLGVKAVDQRIGGNPYPNATDAEWATNGELAGAWIRLTWPNVVTISQVILYDRPNPTDNVLSGTLTFSDGTSVPVGALPPNGSPLLVSFASKTVTWAQFTVNTAQGQNIGLSEIEVFGKLASSTTNNAPQLYQGPVAASETITDAQTTGVSATAFDVDGDTLTYTWTTDAGTITGTGSSVVFNPPAVSAQTVVTITLTVSDGNGGSIQSSEFVTVTPSGSTGISASSLALNPTTVSSGNSSTGTVTLNTAPPTGAVVTLSSDNTAATVPVSITIPPGSLTGTFTVNANYVNSSTLANISASLGTTAPAALTVIPPPVALSSLSVNPVTAGGSNPATGTVTLTAPAQAGGAVVALSSNFPSTASVPTSVTVPAGATGATFPITTFAVADPITVTLTASFVGSTSQATLRVAVFVPPNLATLANVTVSSQDTVDQQQGFKATDGLVDGSPSGDYTKEWATQGELVGAWIRLTWNSPVTASSVVLYDRVNLIDNITSGTLSFSDGTTVPVGTLPNSGNALTVSFPARSVTWVQFTVDSAVGQNIGLAEIAVMGTALQVSGVSLDPASVTGGNSSTGTVTLNGPAPSGGTVVTFSSDNAAATVPASVTVLAGATTATFTVTTSPVAAVTTPTISGTYSGTQTASLTINPPALLSVALNPTSVTGGGSSTGTVALNGAAPSAGTIVTLSSNNAIGTVPASVTVLAGATTATFTVTTTPVAAVTSPTISGTLNGTQTASLTINPPALTSVTLNPTSVTGGTSSTGTVTLNAAAPSSGSVVTLSSDNTAATVPASITVSAGATTATFAVTTSTLAAVTTPTISATFHGTQTASLTINPPAALWSNGYTYRRSITIDHTKTPNSDQLNFPVLISGTYSYLANTGNAACVTNANGYDIIFTSDSTGTTPLSYERESYDGSTGAVNYWVKVPALSHTADTVIYMFYGNSSVTTDQSNKTTVWDSNYAGVWHLSDNAASATVLDSSSNGNNGTAGANTNTKSVIGEISRALTFGGTDEVTTGLHKTAASTWETWFYTAGNTSFRSMITIDGANYLLMDLNGLNGSFWSADGMQGNNLGVAGLSPNSWYHLVLVRSGDNISGTGYKAYLNGVLTGQASSGTLSSGNSITMGYRPDVPVQSWNGNLDEIRISNAARSADWIATEYNNQSSPSTFYSIGVAAGNGGLTVPNIDSLSPNSGAVSTSVTITGTNFGSAQGSSSVTFNGTPATPTSWSANSITAPVPTGATTGNVIVTESGVSSNGANFTVLTDDAWQRGYTYRRTIAIDHTKVSTTDQSNFSVLISGTYSYLATTGNGGNVSNANGYDIIFTSDAGGTSPLSYERESYDGSTGAVNYWVKVPTLSHTADTVIYMFYGNSSVTTDQSNKTAVWDSNYVGVWHLSDNAASATVLDSSSNGNNGTAGANTNTKSVIGEISRALTFGGTDEVTTGLHKTAASTWETWFYTTANSGFRSIIAIDGPNYLLMDLNGLNGSFWSADGLNGTSLGVAGLSPNTWYHLVLIRSGDNSGTGYAAYLNGSLAGQSSSGSLASGNTITFGYRPDVPGQAWNGNLDEIRISNAARSADWIATEYNNQSSPSTFYSIGVAAGNGGLTVPNIDSLSPNSGAVSTSVTITGTNFGSAQGSSSVTFNGTPATPTSWSANSITAPVPTGATTGNVIVTESGVSSNGANFTVLTDDAWQRGYTYRRTIAIDHTKVSTTDQSNFSVLISGTYSYLATTGNGGNVSNANGYDIIFTSDAGGTSPLSYERESYDGSTGAVNYWVKVPTLSHTADTVIYMFYGNSSVTTDQSNKTAVWDSNYVGVWHLNETSGIVNHDSSANNIDANKKSATSPSPAPGLFGGVQSFNGSTDYDTITNTSAIDVGGGNHTSSIWFNANSYSSFNTLFTKESDDSNIDYGFWINSATDGWWAAGKTDGMPWTAPGFTPGTWHYLVMTRTGNSETFYLDGNSVASATFSGTTDSGGNMEIGADHRFGSGYYWNGYLGELRVSNATRSADWIATEYNNQNSPSTFYGIGSAQSGGSVISVVLNPTSVTGGASSSGTVTLDSAAPSSGAVVTLSSDNAAAAVPANVTVLAGATTATFTVTTTPVGAVTTPTISASGNGTQTATLTINPPALTSVALNPNSVTGGTSSTGTVTLNAAAPSSGSVVTLSSDNAAAAVPANVTVLAGATTATFTVTTSPVAVLTTPTISGTYNGTQTASLSINPPGLLSVALNPNSVAGGNSSTGTVTLNAAAPSAGAIVTLSSDNPAATVPASVTVLAGTTTATFTVTTSPVAAATTPTISGTYNGTQTALLTINLPALISVALNPASLTGGTSSTGTVTLNGAAPSAGSIVTLSSDNAAATVPASVTVLAGATTATFTVTTTPVAAVTTPTISGTLNGTQTASLTINPPALASVTLNPTSVTGGTSSTGTVTLNGAAPSAGSIVTLSSDNAAATVPASVTVLAGATTATFTVTTTPVAAVTTPTISGTLNGTQTASLTINPPALASVTLNPASVTGGTSSTGTVTLNGAAPSAGSIVTLSSDNAAATVPASVTVLAGATTATFTVTTTPVAAVTTPTISGTLNGTQTASLTVNPPALLSVTLNPASVTGGNSSTGTVTLNAAAPSAGAIVTLSSDNAAATVPASVTVLAGATTATFTVSTSPVAAVTTPTISGTYNGTQTASLTINPPALASVALNPTSVTGGASSTGTVTLSAAAPSSGAIVTLSSDNAAATVPASVTVLAGATTATFTVTTNLVDAVTAPTISATYNVTKTATLTINPPALLSIVLNPASVTGGTSSTGTVTLTGPATSSGAVVTLSSDNAAALVPASVTVLAGATTATFTVSTSPVGALTTPTISGTFNGTQTASLTINPPGLLSVALNPTSILGGASSTGTVTLNAPAPLSGIVVALSSDNAAAAVPANVTILAGATTATFTVITSPVAVLITPTISGAYNGTQTAVLTINPPGLVSLALNPSSVAGGNSSTGTVTLSAAAPLSGAIVTLSSGNAAATVPASVTVPAGAMTATFSVTTNPVDAVTTPTISGTYNGTQTALLTINLPALASITLNPANLAAGVSSTGTVTLNAAAPPSGAVVTLSSDNAAATVPASVTVLAGATTATFTVTTIHVDTVITPTISGTYNGTQTALLTIDPSGLLSISLNPTSLTGGTSSTGTITLTAPAPSSGAIVTLSSDNAAATVPASVTVVAGDTTATFTVTTNPVAAVTTPTITGSYNGTQTASLTINPPVLLSVALNPTSLTGGTSSTGTVTLNAPAPSSGANVTLSSDNAAAVVSATVSVPAGATTATFNVATNPVAAVTTPTISGSYNGTQTASITVDPPVLLSVALSPTSLTGGTSSTGTVTLSGPAPSSGSVVALSSDNASAAVPVSVTVSSGATTATFTVLSSPVVALTTPTISGTYNGTQTASLTINPPVLLSVALNPASLTGGTSSTGTVTLTGAAPFSGVVVALSSDNAAATVPPRITVLAGSTTATFSVTTNPVDAVTTPTISGAYNGTQTALLTINLPALTSVTLNPASVTGGTSSTGTVTLNAAAPPSGAVVTLSSDNAAATVPASVTVLAGATTATFTVTTIHVDTVITPTISGTYNGTQTALLTIDPSGLLSISLNPTSLTGGTSSTGTITLTAPAPSSGAIVTLSSDNAAATVPVNVTILAGDTTATFTVTTNPVAAVTTPTITGSYNGTQTASLTINPPVLLSLVVNPASVIGGVTSIGTVTLNAPAPSSGVNVTLSSDNAAAVVSATVSVPAGATTATFNVSTNPVATVTTPTISGTYNGTQTASITVNPPALLSVALNPTSLTGETSSTGTVTLSGPAPSSGSVVTLSSDNTAAAVPASVTVLSGLTTATFTVTTTPVSTVTGPTISGTYNGTQTASLTINPPVLNSVALNPASLTGGTSSTGTVTLSGPAPSSGSVVTLSSDNAAATVPASVTVLSGATTATFTVTTTIVSAVTTPTISGTYNGTHTASLTINPSAVISVVMNPTSVLGGTSSTGTVTLNGPAPAAGASVALSSNNAAASVPASVTVLSGATTATFTVTTSSVAISVTPTITATYNGTATGQLTVNAPAVVSVSLNPTTVTGGSVNSTGTVTINGPAPIGGISVGLSSNNTAAATVPASVTVPAGTTSTTFTVMSLAVASQAIASITATLNGNQSATLTVNPAATLVSSVSLNPTSIVGGVSGLTSIGTVTLNGTAPTGGTVVTLTSGTPAAATVPASVTVPANASSTTFTVTPLSVNVSTNVSISAKVGVTTAQSATLTVIPPSVISVSMNPTSVQGGAANSTGTVTLDFATSTSRTVTLSDNSTSAAIPANVIVAANQTTATFTATTSKVAVVTTDTITATLNGSVNTTLTVNPPQISSVTLNPTSIASNVSGAGATSTGTVTLNATAPTGGIVVTLASSNTGAATVPATVTVASGSSTANFTVTSIDGLVATATSSISATLTGGGSQNATLTVIPAATGVATLSLSTSTVQGGTTPNPTGTVTLNGPAPTGGAVVTLASSDTTAATVPASVTVLANATSATFTVTTIKVGTQMVPTISATYKGVQQTAVLTVNPPQINTVTLNPTSIPSNASGTTATSTGTVTLNATAPTGGIVVTLASSNTGAATVSATVTVASGSSTANFTVTSIDGLVATATSSISATLAGGGSQNATLTVIPAATGVATLSLSTSTVQGGTAPNPTGTVTLNGPAPTGGAVVTLASSDTSAATVPASVTVLANATSATFTVTTIKVGIQMVPTISATYKGVQQTAVLTVNPPQIISVTLTPTSVIGGVNSTATVTLNTTAPAGGVTVSLASDNTAVANPAVSTVTVPSGSNSTTFTVNTQAVATAAPAHISATLTGAGSQSGTLTVNPPTLSNLTLSPSSVIHPASSTGTVSITGAAPAGGFVVNLSSSDITVGTVPATMTVAAGSTTGTFTVTTLAAAPGNSKIAISASATGSTTQTANLTVN